MPTRYHDTKPLLSTLRSMLTLGLILLSLFSFAQTDTLFNKPSQPFQIITQPVRFHEPRKTDPNLQLRMKASPIELANNPNYPITLQEFDRRIREYNKTFGEQIVDDIIISAANRILYPKKYKRPAKVPHF